MVIFDMAEYDLIAKEYSSTEETHLKKKYMVIPSLFMITADMDKVKGRLLNNRFIMMPWPFIPI